MLLVALSLLGPLAVFSLCPYFDVGTPVSESAEVPLDDIYNTAVDGLDISAVFDDLFEVFTDSQECWPADTLGGITHYGGLFIRLAWHCSGSYRDTDGEGGCAGGRMRFPPEAHWDDNTNLDKARALLGPIKEKYGDALSWGDLMIFAGTASIYHMGGPVTEVCAGRIDDADGTLSLPLGPGDEAPDCAVQGECEAPLGADTIGLIYVNPEGVLGDPNPAASAVRIREVFSRMDMNDTETVALIGGGHAFGKSHGACPDGPGAGPDEQPENPWPGVCGDTGMGEETYTSGIEGAWTTSPFTWDNEFYQLLIDEDDEFTLIEGPGEKHQWENSLGLMMLTTDLALVADDDYKAIVTTFAGDLDALNEAFAGAWEKLTTSGGTWASNKKCIQATELSDLTVTETTTATPMDEATTATTATPEKSSAIVWGLGLPHCLLALALVLVL